MAKRTRPPQALAALTATLLGSLLAAAVAQADNKPIILPPIIRHDKHKKPLPKKEDLLPDGQVRFSTGEIGN